MLGLPDGIGACLFDLDGVLTKTAAVHARAWAQTFADYGFTDDDYNEYVDGKPREDGVRDFLASRGVHPGEAEIRAIGERKNALVQQLIRDEGVEAYDGSRAYLEAAERAGLRRAVVSSSHNAAAVLDAAGLSRFIEVRVDGHDTGLRGKPAPDTFLEAARRLEHEPARCAVFEDALAGVEAGRAGGFGCVVGVDRVGHRDALLAHGADVVVEDLAELL